VPYLLLKKNARREPRRICSSRKCQPCARWDLNQMRVEWRKSPLTSQLRNSRARRGVCHSDSEVTGHRNTYPRVEEIDNNNKIKVKR